MPCISGFLKKKNPKLFSHPKCFCLKDCFCGCVSCAHFPQHRHTVNEQCDLCSTMRSAQSQSHSRVSWDQPSSLCFILHTHIQYNQLNVGILNFQTPLSCHLLMLVQETSNNDLSKENKVMYMILVLLM